MYERMNLLKEDGSDYYIIIRRFWKLLYDYITRLPALFQL